MTLEMMEVDHCLIDLVNTGDLLERRKMGSVTWQGARCD